MALQVVPATAAATPPELFGEFGESGSGAGQIANPEGIATSPVDGHIFLTEATNNRVSEYTAWGEFVKSFGWGVRDGAAEAQTCTSESGCTAGLAGAGAGEFESPNGIGVDSSGDVYVFEGGGGTHEGVLLGNFRMQKFSPAGQFLWMVGGGVDKGPHHPGNLCTVAFIAEGDECGKGSRGTGSSEFLIEGAASGDYLAVGPEDSIYVADKGRIQAFAIDGSIKSQFALPENSKPADPENSNPGALDVDLKTGNLYFAFRQGFGIESTQPPGVYKLSPTGTLLAPPLDLWTPKAIATDSDGNVYVSHEPLQIYDPETEIQHNYPEEVVEYDPAGEAVIGLGSGFATPTGNAKIRAVTENSIGDFIVAYFSFGGGSDVRIYGPPPVSLGPPPKVPPSILSSYALSADSDSATVRSTINPRYWADTTYRVEYGQAPCSEGGCALSPGAKLTDKVISTPLTSGGVFLGALKPNTTYHYRFVAESGGGGPVFGPDRTFTTFPPPPPPPSGCPNQAYRPGHGAFLPDCRAYEMVSPLDKNGGDILTLAQINSYLSAYDQSAASGEKLTYSSYRAFGDAESASYTSQYIASRGPGGWSSEGISPPRSGGQLGDPGNNGLDNLYHGFTSELQSGFVVQGTEPTLAPGALAGYRNLYRRDNESGAYEVLIPETPVSSEPELQGLSKDGHCAIFTSSDRLIAKAKAGNLVQLYESCGGEVSLVSILPNGAASALPSSAGTKADGGVDRSSSVWQAISEDGSRVFWSQSSAGPGPLYVRIDGEETLALSTGLAQFWGAAADGSKAVFSEGETLYEYDVEAEMATPIAAGVEGVMGMSTDASRIYFVSTQALALGATAGQRSLYLDDGGTETFIAALGGKEGGSSSTSPTYPAPSRHTARVSPDGASLAFMSSGAPTAYDNADADSGEADNEVYIYRLGPDQLRCVSCNPSGVRPSGRHLNKANTGNVWAAALIPTFQSQLYGSRVLSDDGKRLFFESFEALTPSDTNGKGDVYEWEAPGSGDCSTESATYRPPAGGCVSLISTGEDPTDSEFLDASADGRDVFFTTASSLVVQDPGLIDIYDARAGGGFPPPPTPPAACEGEACQGPLIPPNDPTPASAAFEGAGNVKEGAAPRARCAKGKVRSHSRCVKAHKKRKQHNKKKQKRAQRRVKSSREGAK